jgi:hypothetical protein
MCNDVCANTASKGVEAIEKEILDLETMLKEHIDSLGRKYLIQFFCTVSNLNLFQTLLRSS